MTSTSADQTALLTIGVAGGTFRLRPAARADLPAILRLLADDQLGSSREDAQSRTAAHRFYERLGFAASHEGMKLLL